MEGSRNQLFALGASALEGGNAGVPSKNGSNALVELGSRAAELRSFDPPWYDRLAYGIGGLLHGDNANARQIDWVKKFTGPENPIPIVGTPAQLTHAAHSISEGWRRGDLMQMGLGLLEAGMGAAPLAPFARPAAKAIDSALAAGVRAMPEGVGSLGGRPPAPKPEGITAYHGSPMFGGDYPIPPPPRAIDATPTKLPTITEVQGWSAQSPARNPDHPNHRPRSHDEDAFWSSTNRRAAEMYLDAGPDRALHDVTARFKNPMIVEAGRRDWNNLHVSPELKNYYKTTPNAEEYEGAIRAIPESYADMARALGHDGVVFKNINDVPFRGRAVGDTFVALKRGRVFDDEGKLLFSPLMGLLGLGSDRAGNSDTGSAAP